VADAAGMRCREAVAFTQVFAERQSPYVVRVVRADQSQLSGGIARADRPHVAGQPDAAHGTRPFVVRPQTQDAVDRNLVSPSGEGRIGVSVGFSSLPLRQAASWFLQTTMHHDQYRVQR
jgi:hypothetical protein